MNSNEQLLDTTLEELRQSPIPPFPREIVLNSFSGGQHHSAAFAEWSHTIMKYRLPIAAATTAIILLAAFWNWGPLGGQQSFALQQVGDALQQVTSVRYKLTTTGWGGRPWPDPYVRTILVSAADGLRTEDEFGLQVSDLRSGRLTRLIHKERKVIIMPFYDPENADVAMLRGTGFVQKLQADAAKAVRSAETTMSDGRRVVEFRWKNQGEDFLVTADANTLLPIRMEVDQGRMGDKEIREVYSDFVYDEPIDSSLFKIDVPEGYTVEDWKPDPNNKSYPEGDAEQLIVSPGRFGPITKGMRETDIVRLLGAPDWIDRRKIGLPSPSPDVLGVEGDQEIITLEYYSRGFSLTLLPSGDINASCHSRTSSGPLVRNFAGRTLEGIGIGDSRRKVLDTYGKPDIEQRDNVSYMELGWQFHFRDGVLSGIITSTPRPLNQPGGIQTRILKDGRTIQAVPGVDIDAMLDEEGNLKEGGKFQRKRVIGPESEWAEEPQSPKPNP